MEKISQYFVMGGNQQKIEEEQYCVFRAFNLLSIRLILAFITFAGGGCLKAI